MPDISQIRSDAAGWLARLHADDRSAADEEAFRIWMLADPAHASAFESVTEMWEAASALPRDLRRRACPSSKHLRQSRA